MWLWLTRAVHETQRETHLCDLRDDAHVRASQSGALLMEMIWFGFVFMIAVGVIVLGILHLFDRLDGLKRAIDALPTACPEPPAPPPSPPVVQTYTPFQPGRPVTPTRIICVDRGRKAPRAVVVDRPSYLLRLPGGEYHRVGVEGQVPIYALTAGNHRQAMEAVTRVH